MKSRFRVAVLRGFAAILRRIAAAMRWLARFLLWCVADKLSQLDARTFWGPTAAQGRRRVRRMA